MRLGAGLRDGVRTRGASWARWSGDRGSMAVVELPFGFLWIIAVAVVVLTLPTWIERQSAARSAADEAARVVVTAQTCGAGIERAQATVAEIELAHDLDPGDLALEVECSSLRRGSEVTAHVRMTVPAVSLPMGIEVGSFSHTASHTELVDLYRSA